MKKHIVKDAFGHLEPKLLANINSHIHMAYYIGNTFIQYIRIKMGWTGFVKSCGATSLVGLYSCIQLFRLSMSAKIMWESSSSTSEVTEYSTVNYAFKTIFRVMLD